MTQILVYGKIFDNIRPKHKFFHCPMCIGFHVGWFVGLLSPCTKLLNFDLSLVTLVLLGFLSSGTSYIFNMLFGDSGINIHNSH